MASCTNIQLFLVFMSVYSCVSELNLMSSDRLSFKLNLCSSFNSTMFSEEFNQIELPAAAMSSKENTNFTIQKNEEPLKCSNPISLSAQTIVEVSPPKFLIEPNGDLELGINNFRPNDYCIERFDGLTLKVSICNPCSENPIITDSHTSCIQKCCNANSVFYNKCTRVNSRYIWSQKEQDIQVHDSRAFECFNLYKNGPKEMLESCLKQSQIPEIDKVYYFYSKSHLNCFQPTVHSTISTSDRFAMLGNGSVILELDHKDIMLLSHDFCLDYEMNSNQNKLIPIMLACLPPPPPAIQPVEKEIDPHVIIPEPIKDNMVQINKCKQTQFQEDVLLIPHNLLWSDHGQDSWFSINGTFEPNCPKTRLKTIDFGHDNNNVEQKTIYFTSDGVVLVDKEFYQPFEYCVQSYKDSSVTLKLCDISCEDETNNIVCVSKCCSWDNYFTNSECASKKDFKWTPKIYNEHNQSVSTKKHIHYKEGGICDEHQAFSSVENFRQFELLGDGSAVVIVDGEEHMVPYEFCLDGEIINDTFLAEVLIMCAPPDEDTSFEELVSKGYVVMMFISSIFLLMTIIVYALIWDKHNIHGWTVFGYSISMFFMLILLAAVHLININENENFTTDHSGKCQTIALLAHYFFLSTFCWLTMLNFDLWWTFRTLTPTSMKSKGFERFKYYILFCLGAPLLIVSLAFILDKTLSHENSPITLPKYGHRHCYMSREAQGPYLYYLIGTLLVINLIFFGNTIYIMYQYQKNSRTVRKGKSNSQSQSAQLFAKLFLVMGVTWILEVISWKLKSKHLIWVFFDLINLIQGIAIFIIFVCKKPVLAHLWHKYPKLRPVLSPFLKLCKFSTVDIENREISGTKVTSTSNNSMKQYTANPRGTTISRASTISYSDSAM